jgi:hypothetical protein
MGPLEARRSLAHGPTTTLTRKARKLDLSANLKIGADSRIYARYGR